MTIDKRITYVLLFLAPLLACGSTTAVTKTPTPPTVIPGPSPTPYMVTMDGTENGELAVPFINVWLDYEDRTKGMAGTVNHGTRVQLIRREGDAVLIELPHGKRGWVTYWFIKELK